MNTNGVRIVDSVLTGSLALTGKKYIANDILPIVYEPKDAVKVPTWGYENLNVTDLVRAPGALVARIEPTIANEVYKMEEYALEEPIPYEIAEIADPNLQYELSVTRLLEDQMLRQKENQVAQLFSSTANFGTSTAVSVGAWDTATGVPITDLQAARTTFIGQLGYEPNTLVLDAETWLGMQYNPEVKGWRNYANAGSIGPDALKELFGVEKVLIGYNIKSTNPTNTTIEVIYPNFAAFLYVTPTPAPTIMSWGYCFTLRGYPQVEKWIDYPHRSNVVRYLNYYVPAVVAKIAGVLITGTHS